MTRKLTWVGATFLMLMLLSWGCADNNNASLNATGDQITDAERDDVADDYAATLAAPDEGMLRYWVGGMGGGSGGLRDAGDRLALDDTSTFDRNGFHVVIVRNYYDSLGNYSPVYDTLTSVRLDRLMWINGTHTNQSGRRTVTIDHFDSTVVFGIDPISQAFTLEGSGTRTVNSEFASRFNQNVKTLDATYSWVIHDVIVDKDREAHPYPMGGNIAVAAVITRTHNNPGRNFESTVETSFIVYFDGTQWAHVVFDDGREYWIDLSLGWCYRDRP